MRIAAITKLKQGDIYEALKRLGWTQSELSKRSGISQQTLGMIINLKLKPSKEAATRIQEAFAKDGEFVDVWAVWPETFLGFKKAPVIEQIQDVDFGRIIGQSHTPLLGIVKEERDEAIRELLNTLTEEQRDVMESRMRGQTLDEIGHRRGVTREWVRQLEVKAIRSMQYPARKKIVEDFIDVEAEESRETL